MERAPETSGGKVPDTVPLPSRSVPKANQATAELDGASMMLKNSTPDQQNGLSVWEFYFLNNIHIVCTVCAEATCMCRGQRTDSGNRFHSVMWLSRD